MALLKTSTLKTLITTKCHLLGHSIIRAWLKLELLLELGRSIAVWVTKVSSIQKSGYSKMAQLLILP